MKTATKECYEITDTVRIRDLPSGASRLDIWIPLISDDPHQRVLDRTIEAPSSGRITHDSEFGNTMYHLACDAGPVEVCVRTRVTREQPSIDLSEHRVGTIGGRSDAWQLHLRPERHVTVDEESAERARGIVGDETNLLKQARAIYDHVTGFMSYDAEKQSWVGSSDHALTCQVGNCNDIHALFLSLSRSIGIPSRMVMGFALEAPDGDDECEVCGYHCWAEFFAPSIGWVPVDASCVCKYDKEPLFGDLELNHIAFSRGRDLLLNPPQSGERLLFLASAYAEVDGQKHVGIDRKLTFRREG